MLTAKMLLEVHNETNKHWTCQWHLYEWPNHMSNYKNLYPHMTSEQIPEKEEGEEKII